MKKNNQRLWDKSFDGHRFEFHIQYNTMNTTIKDTLNEFEDFELPNDVAELLAIMLNDLHDLQIDKKSSLGSLKSLISIVEETDLDKDVLMTCIKFGMDEEISERNGGYTACAVNA